MKNLNHYNNNHVCPITGNYTGHSFTDHKRPGLFNSCSDCNPKKYVPVGKRLHDLNEKRKRESK